MPRLLAGPVGCAAGNHLCGVVYMYWRMWREGACWPHMGRRLAHNAGPFSSEQCASSSQCVCVLPDWAVCGPNWILCGTMYYLCVLVGRCACMCEWMRVDLAVIHVVNHAGGMRQPRMCNWLTQFRLHDFVCMRVITEFET